MFAIVIQTYVSFPSPFHCSLSSKPEFCASLLERFVLEDKKQMLLTDNLSSGFCKHTGGRVGKSVFGIEWGGGREKRRVREGVEVMSGASKALVEDAWKADSRSWTLAPGHPSSANPPALEPQSYLPGKDRDIWMVAHSLFLGPGTMHVR